MQDDARFRARRHSAGMPPRRCWPSRRCGPCGGFTWMPSRGSTCCSPTPGASSKATAMRDAILFYCQHVLGMGHLVRSMTLARALADRFRAVVVELFPFGRKQFAEELLPLFEETRAAGAHRPLLVSSLRDILTTGHRDQVGYDERGCTLANRYLDAILVHADPHFARLEDSFRPEQDLRVPVYYTGFVVAGAARPLDPCRTRRLIVSAGGGLAGGPLFRAAVEAHGLLWRRERLRTTVVAGPFLPEADWRALRRAARQVAGLELRRSVPNLGERLLDAAASVSQCGYNT